MRFIGKFIFILLMGISALECVADSLDDMVKNAAASTSPQVGSCCRRNCDIWNQKECRLDRCHELDELGTQLPVSDKVHQQAQDWVMSRFSQMPRFYCAKPKKILVRDEIVKRRQDYILKVVYILKDVAQYAYEQAVLYGIDMERFETLAGLYSDLMNQRAWRDIGSNQGRDVDKATKMLIGKIEEMNLLNVTIYDSILLKKKNQHHVFLQDHPTAVAAVQAKIAQREARILAIRAQEENRQRELLQWEEEQREEEEREANRRGDHGDEARDEQFRNDEVARRALRKAEKDAKKGIRRPLTAEEINRIGTPATAIHH